MKDLKLMIRFDDLCPTMNHDMWRKVEKICMKNQISPILAVIPDNHDPKFNYDYDSNFWMRIKYLQEKGWSIGLHGLHHTNISENSGLMGITELSEFIPKSYVEQDDMIKKGLKIFRENNIIADMFVAPYHSFDMNTLKALKNNDIYIVSDGFYSHPVKREGIIYIPCQLWERSRIPHNGFYTICCHTDQWDENDLLHFEQLVKRHKKRIISFAEIGEIKDVKKRDIFLNWLKIKEISIKKQMKKIINIFKL